MGTTAAHDRLASDQVTNWVTIATDNSGRQGIAADDLFQARGAALLAGGVCTWLRDEEAAGQIRFISTRGPDLTAGCAVGTTASC